MTGGSRLRPSRCLSLFPVDNHVVDLCSWNHRCTESILHVADPDVVESEVAKLVFVTRSHIEEVFAVHGYVLHGDIPAERLWHIHALLRLEELCPWAHDEEAAGLSGNVLHGDILVLLWRVGTHFQPQHAVGVAACAVAEDDVPVVEALRAKGEHAVDGVVGAVLNQHSFDGTIHGHSVGVGALAALEDDGIVVDIHKAPVDEDVMAFVNIYGIGTRCLDTAGGSVDVAAEVAHVVAIIDVVGPKRTVHQSDILHGDVAGIGDIDQPWALSILVGALAVPLPSYPELVPVVESVAVDSPLSGDGESVDVVGVDESGEVFARLALDACLDNLEIGYAVRPFKLAALLDVQMGGGLEEQRTAEECALRYHNHTATIGSCPVDDGLNGIGLDNGGIVLYAIIGDDIPAAERCRVDFRGVAEP